MSLSDARYTQYKNADSRPVGSIGDVLKEHKPGQEPRFFLHEEMKMWLKKNLKMAIYITPVSDMSSVLSNKLAIHQFTTGANIDVSLSIDDELIMSGNQTVSLYGHKESIEKLSNIAEACMVQINQLLNVNTELRRRIELLENPIPV